MQTTKPSIVISSIQPTNTRKVTPVNNTAARNTAISVKKTTTRDRAAIIITMVLAIISVCAIFTGVALACVLCGASFLTSVSVCGVTMVILGLAAWFCVEYVAYRITK